MSDAEKAVKKVKVLVWGQIKDVRFSIGLFGNVTQELSFKVKYFYTAR